MKSNKTNYLKLSVLSLMMMVGTAINAQTTDASDGVAQGDKAGESIRLIDNKGTIKYLQSNNGITTITSTEAGNKTTTTWQLGGSLTENTYIDATGKVFALDGIELASGAASSNAITGEVAKGGAATGLGWTLLVRDEATGATKKLLATDLVSGIRTEYIQGTTAVVAPTVNNGDGDATNDVIITVTGLPTLTAATTAAKLFVFRNGAKLRSGVDFTAGVDKVTITYDAADMPMYSGDVIEIQYIK